MGDTEPTLGELFRCLERVEKRLDDGDHRFDEHKTMLVRLATQMQTVLCEVRKGRRQSLGSATAAGGFVGGAVGGAVAAFLGFFRGS